MNEKNIGADIVHLNRAIQSPRRERLEGGGGGPYDSDMEERINRLEKTTEEIKSALGRLEPTITKIRDDTNEIKGKLAHMPTIWSVFAVVVSVFAFAFVLLRFAAPLH